MIKEDFIHTSFRAVDRPRCGNSPRIELLLEAYQSGYSYLAFAKQAQAVPPWATKETHGDVRELYKTCILAVNYGMAALSLSLRTGKHEIVAHQLLEHYHR